MLLVSPHLDDAALSCGVLLDRGEPLDVLTVFTGVPEHPVETEWDRRSGFSSAAEAMAARLQEDHIAFQGSGHRLHHLGLLDHGYSQHPRPASDGEAVGASVRRWLEENPTGLVALPAGAGRPGPRRLKLDRLMRRFEAGRPRHPDHVFVRDAALNALGIDSRRGLLLYEEVPYSFSLPGDAAISEVESAVGARAIAQSTEVDRGRKARRIAAYRSQLPHLCPNGLRLDAADALPVFERYWHLVRP